MTRQYTVEFRNHAISVLGSGITEVLDIGDDIDPHIVEAYGDKSRSGIEREHIMDLWYASRRL